MSRTIGCLVALTCLLASSASAQEGVAELPEPAAEATTKVVDPLAPGLTEPDAAPQGEPLRERRDRPDYDGVQDRTTFGEALLWVPRVILFPLWVVSEYVVRRPLAWVVTGIEEQRLLPKLKHYTTIGSDDGEGVYAGVSPIARFDTGFRFAVGLLFWAENLIWHDSELRLGVDSDFLRNATVDAQYRIAAGSKLRLIPKFRFAQRDDFRFFGTGAAASVADESRFFRRKTLGGLEAELEAPSPGVGARLAAEVSQNEFDCSDSEDRDICGPDGVARNDDDPFNSRTLLDSYSLFRVTARVYADSRPPRPESGTGARLEVFSRLGSGLSNSDIQFLRAGTEGALFWDIYQQRVLGLRVAAETTIREGTIPFSEQILLGGPELMRGFSRGRMHGLSSFVASLDYRYPVWSLADGTIFFEVGNVFDELSDLEIDAMRGSFGFGIRSVGSRHVSLDLLIAAGTTRFDDANFGLESGRLSIGTNWGF